MKIPKIKRLKEEINNSCPIELYGNKRVIIFELITHALSGYLLSVSIVGYTIAGLIANDFYKQGVKKTLPALAICVCLLELIVIIGYQLGV